MRTVAWIAMIAGCAEPGTVWSALQPTSLRSALYRVGTRQGSPELVILLSNGELTCGLPDLEDAQAYEALLTAACREGAQHTVLRLYASDRDWLGEFPGLDGASGELLAPERPRLAGGAFYAVVEAALVEIDGLGRFYAATEARFLPELGTGGSVVVERLTDSTLQGWFSFPEEALSGEFRAQRCEEETSLIDTVAPQSVQLCD